MPTGTPLRRRLSNTAASERSENRPSSHLRNANIYIRQDHVILNIAQVQHRPTFIGISYSLYISFIQANTQFVSASTMYAIQSNANSCMPSAPSARSGSPPRCCKHLPSDIHVHYGYPCYVCKCRCFETIFEVNSQVGPKHDASYKMDVFCGLHKMVVIQVFIVAS